MPFIPFAATVGSWLGGSAALGGTAIAAGGAAVGSAGSSAYQGSASRTAAKKASDATVQRQDKAAADLTLAQKTASSQAAARVNQRRARKTRGSKSVYSSPLGIAGTAKTARKKLLGE